MHRRRDQDDNGKHNSSLPRGSALDHRSAMRLAATEYTRMADLLEGLSPKAWASPTVCSG